MRSVRSIRAARSSGRTCEARSSGGKRCVRCSRPVSSATSSALVSTCRRWGSGDERFLRFLTEVHLAPRDGGEAVIAAFRDFAVFQRVEGRWTILRNIDQPISPEQLAADLLRDPPLAVIGNPAN